MSLLLKQIWTRHYTLKLKFSTCSKILRTTSLFTKCRQTSKIRKKTRSLNRNYISRVILTQQKCNESAATLFTKKKSIFPISGFSNEILGILEAQEDAKLEEIKVLGPTKNLPLGLIYTTRVQLGFSPDFYLWWFCSPLSYKDAKYLI